MGDQNAGADNGAEEQKPADDGSQSDNGGNSDDKNKGDNNANDNKNQNDESDDGETPAIRKDPKDFIINRLKEKNTKLAENKNKREDDEEDDNDDDIPADDEAIINRVINKNFGNVLAKTEEQQDKAELNEFMGANPEFKKYSAKIWRFWQDPSRRHLPASTIAYEVAGKDLLKIGAERGKIADEKAKESSNTGGNAGTVPGKKPISEMSVDEFLAYKEEVKRRPTE